MKKLLYFAFVLSVLFLTASCDREGVIYQPADDEASVTFFSTKAVYEMVAEDGNKIVVDLYRGVTTSALSVPVTITDNTGGVFVPDKNQFDFAAGENKASITFNYGDINALDFGKYTLSIAIDDATLVAPSGNKKVDITASRKVTRVSKGYGLYYSDWFEEEWDQELQAVAEVPGMYYLPDCWVAGTDFSFTMEGGQPVFPAIIETGYSYGSYGAMYMYVAQATTTYGAPAPSYDATDNYILYYAVYRVAAGAFALSYEEFDLPEGVTL